MRQKENRRSQSSSLRVSYMGRIGDRAALGIFLILSGSTMAGLGMTSLARSSSRKQKEKNSTFSKESEALVSKSDFNARLESLDR